VLDQLAREMGVSAVPVREAIRRLEAERLVTFTRNVGAEVAAIDLADYADAMEVLAWIEGAATALSAPHLTKRQIDDAATTNDHMRSLAGGNFDPRLFSDLNLQFHEQLCIACPNAHLLDLLHREWERVGSSGGTCSASSPCGHRHPSGSTTTSSTSSGRGLQPTRSRRRPATTSSGRSASSSRRNRPEAGATHPHRTSVHGTRAPRCPCHPIQVSLPPTEK
jgi:hypothetical protein